MTPVNRRLLRAAGRIQTAYGTARIERRELDLPESYWRNARQTFYRWTLARSRGWSAAAARARESLAAELEYLGNQLRSRIVALQEYDGRPGPTLRMLYDELAATETEFNGLEVHDSELAVTTDPIVLEGIRLGPFQIRLDFARLGSETPYSVTALEPNPAASCSDTTHPHVSGERLCPGEGRGAIAAALAEGRLFDFFTIVDCILHTYAVGSAYIELDRWHGVPCHDCDCSVSEDDAASCPGCEETLCGNCQVCCGGCSSGFCSGCIDRCALCDEPYCTRCLNRCIRCRREVCESCFEDELCPDCREELEHEPEEPFEESTATTNSTAEPTI